MLEDNQFPVIILKEQSLPGKQQFQLKRNWDKGRYK